MLPYDIVLNGGDVYNLSKVGLDMCFTADLCTEKVILKIF